MRLLALSDIHGATAGLAALSDLMQKVDLVLIAGDLTEFGGSEELREVLAFLQPAAGKAVAVPGNCDRRGARELLDSEGLSADGRLLERGGALIAGSGGGMLHTGLTPYERREEELAAALESALASVSANGDAHRPLIILSHTPPYDSGADSGRGGSSGSRRLRSILDRETPPLWICGHIHESRSAQRRGETLVVNPGPLRDGHYALIEMSRGAGGTWSAGAELPIMDVTKRRQDRE